MTPSPRRVPSEWSVEERDRAYQKTAATLASALETSDAKPQHMPLRDYMQNFVERQLPPYDPSHFRGAGVVMFAGTTAVLPPAMLAVSWIRHRLNSTVPIEVFRGSEEPDPPDVPYTDVTFRRLPPLPAEKQFSLKAMCVAAATFDTVLFLDADAVPMIPPEEFFSYLSNRSAVFWPDYWTLFSTADIWHHVPWPGGSGSETSPSMESSVLVVCKSCGAWRPLVLAAFMNHRSEIFYPAIYYNSAKQRAHGYGDKDTFLVSWLFLREPYRMMPPPGTLGPRLSQLLGTVCGGAIAQLTPDRRVATVHHNGNKWLYKDWVERSYIIAPDLAIGHLAVLINDERGGTADGLSIDGGVTILDRATILRAAIPCVYPDYDRDCPFERRPVPYTQCVVFRVDSVGVTITSFPHGPELRRELDAVYSSPWLASWFSRHTSGT